MVAVVAVVAVVVVVVVVFERSKCWLFLGCEQS